jgi:hypothetical protein
MPYKVPEKSGGGATAAGLVDKLIAILPIEEDVFDTKMGKRPGYRVKLYEIQLNGATVVDLVGPTETTFFQMVLVDKLRYHEPKTDWLVGRIVKPNKAFLLDPPRDDEIAGVEAAIEKLDVIAADDAEAY